MGQGLEDVGFEAAQRVRHRGYQRILIFVCSNILGVFVKRRGDCGGGLGGGRNYRFVGKTCEFGVGLNAMLGCNLALSARIWGVDSRNRRRAKRYVAGSRSEGSAEGTAEGWLGRLAECAPGQGWLGRGRDVGAEPGP